MSWLSDLLNRLSELWPFVRIAAYERGVRTTYIPRRGIKVDVLGPGVHLRLWWFQTVTEQVVVEQSENLPTQSCTCKDGTQVTLSVNFTYEVTDAEAAVNNVTQLSDSLCARAMMQVAKKLRGWTWAELVAGQSDLERSIRETLTTRAKDWGIRITDCGITDLVQARTYRFFGDPPIAP